MEQKSYYLMHRDDPVCTVSIDPMSGNMLRVSQTREADLLPPGGRIDAEALRLWWHRRAVPVTQGRILSILEEKGISSPQEYLVRNLGLSLSDHYWIKPLDSDISWHSVNLFTNDFRDPIGEMLFDLEAEVPEIPSNAFSPSSSTQGDLRKKWVILNGKRCLIKGNHGSNAQESLNEVFATLVHQKQQKQPYVEYKTVKIRDRINCICESFTSDAIEFIPAADLIHSEKRNNSVSVYEHLIGICVKNGLDENVVRSFLEYQILTDYLITNTDRHLNNFGILRDTHSLKFVRMAPIFDSGNSMFWSNPTLPAHQDLTNIPVNSILKKESAMLSYVKDPKQIDMNKVPTLEEFYQIYSQDPLIPCLDIIASGYQKKIFMLRER